MRVPQKILFASAIAIVSAAAVDVFVRAASENPFPARGGAAAMERIARALGDDLDRIGAEDGVAGVTARVAGAQREHGEDAAIRLVALDASGTATMTPGLDKQALAPLGAAGNAPISILRRSDNGARVLVYRALRPLNGRALALELDQTITVDDAVGRLIADEARTAAFMLLAVGAVVLMLGSLLIQKPAAAIAEGLRRLGSGNDFRPLDVRQDDEIGELARETNNLAQMIAAAREKQTRDADAREESMEELRRAERLSTVGRLASNLAHELGTPLNVVSGRAMMIASGEVTGTEVPDNGKIIVDQANKMTSYIKQMLGHARKKQPKKSPANIELTLPKVISLLGRFASKNNVHLEFDPKSEPAVLDIGEMELLQILTNLVTNAVQAMPNGGKIVLGAKRDKKEGASTGHLSIYVRDQGVGIKKEDLQNVFKPFYTTRTDSAGTGLGLSIAQGIVREHGGWIDVESELGAGSCFKVCLPQGGA